MKTYQIFLVAAVVLGSLSSCVKEDVPVQVGSSETIASSGIPKANGPIQFRFRHPCDGGIGACVIIPIGRMNVTQQDSLDGYGHADLEFPTTSSVTIIPWRPLDDGSGRLVLDDDWSVTSQAAALYNKSSITLKAGTYTMNYSNVNDRYGRVTVDADVQ